MKKLIVLLLAFAMVGAVSAQVTTAVSLSGNVVVVDQAGKSVFAPNGNGYDTITLSAKEKDGKYGFSLTDQNLLDGSFDTIRDWTVWSQGDYVKASVGLLRNGTFRLGQLYGGTKYLTWTDRITGYGLLVETKPMNGLTFGVNLPVPNVADTLVNVLQNVDVGAKYVMDKVLTGIVMLNLDTVAPAATVLNAGVKYIGIENLPITVLAKAQLNANDYRVAVGTDYTGVDKLDLFAEADVKFGAAFGWTVFAEGDYAVSDKLTAIVGGSVGDGITYDVYGEVDYACLPGMTGKAVVGFDGALYAQLKLGYSVSF